MNYCRSILYHIYVICVVVDQGWVTAIGEVIPVLLKVKGTAYDRDPSGRPVENIYTFDGVRDFIDDKRYFEVGRLLTSQPDFTASSCVQQPCCSPRGLSHYFSNVCCITPYIPTIISTSFLSPLNIHSISL